MIKYQSTGNVMIHRCGFLSISYYKSFYVSSFHGVEIQDSSLS